jgi:hypothetical protein
MNYVICEPYSRLFHNPKSQRGNYAYGLGGLFGSSPYYLVGSPFKGISQTGDEMKLMPLCLCVFFLAINCYGDEKPSQALIDSLEKVRNELKTQLSAIEAKISLLKFDMKRSQSLFVNSLHNAKIKSKPGALGETTGTIPKHTQVQVVGWKSGYWEILWNNKAGYAKTSYFDENPTAIDRFKTKQPNQAELEAAWNPPDKQIKTYCLREWPDNYRMQVHCIEEQTRALYTYADGNVWNVPNHVFRNTREQCDKEWSGGNYRMKVYCEKQQFEAYKKLH